MANPKHAIELMKGVLEWNQWRKQNPRVRPDLQGENLSDRDLRHIDFHKANLNEVDLNRSLMAQANLSGASLCKASLKGTNLYKANLSGTNLTEAIIAKAKLIGADFSFTYSARVDLSEADLSEADLRHATLINSKFDKAVLSKAILRMATLGYSDLSWSNLQDADLRGAQLIGADLSNANLKFTNLSNLSKGCSVRELDEYELNVRFGDPGITVLKQANLRNADLTKANLCGAICNMANFNNATLTNSALTNTDFSNSDLSGVDLRKVNLSVAKLKETILKGVDWSGATLNDLDLREIDLTEANFEGADFQEIALKGAVLHRANLKGAFLNHLELQENDLSGANFELAELKDAKLYGANLSGAHLSKTIMFGLDARFSIVDGSTLINECTIDRNTDFSGVGLDNARIEGSLKSDLKRNIRQKHWERRYKKNKFLNIVRLFWWASDYGNSTIRIVWTFLGLSLMFSIVYLIGTPAPDGASWPTPFANPFLVDFSDDIVSQSPCSNYLGLGCSIELWFRSLYFSVVTMTTLGFGDIHAHSLSITGQALVMLQVLIGYVLLGALITRLSILFQDVG